MVNVLVNNFSGAYREQGFLSWLQGKDTTIRCLDWEGLAGCCCYCDAQAAETICRALPTELPRLRFLDSGDYHYMTLLLALREPEPFHLLLLDHHPDDQAPAFGGVLSCGSWVRDMREGNVPLLSVLGVGPEGCPQDLPPGWLEERRGERIYISLDKDVMNRRWARTDWTQGRHSLPQVERLLLQVFQAPVQVVAVDVCGECPASKGGTPEDMRINYRTNIELYTFITNYLK